MFDYFCFNNYKTQIMRKIEEAMLTIFSYEDNKSFFEK